MRRPSRRSRRRPGRRTAPSRSPRPRRSRRPSRSRRRRCPCAKEPRGEIHEVTVVGQELRIHVAVFPWSTVSRAPACLRGRQCAAGRSAWPARRQSRHPGSTSPRSPGSVGEWRRRSVGRRHLLQLPSAKNPTKAPSGDQKGSRAPSVPARGYGSERANAANPEHRVILTSIRCDKGQAFSVGRNGERRIASIAPPPNDVPSGGRRTNDAAGVLVVGPRTRGTTTNPRRMTTPPAAIPAAHRECATGPAAHLIVRPGTGGA